MLPYLPPELVEIVIAETQRHPDGLLPTKPPFRRNKAHLASYSLVCRLWRPIAQALLFHEVIMTLERRSPGEFLAFMRQCSPHIARAVRFLVFTATSLPIWIGRDGKPLRGEIEVCPAVLMEILRTLPGVAHVKFQGFAILGWPQDVPLPAQRLYLKRLALKALRYKPLSEPHLLPFDILSFFSAETLEVHENAVLQPADREAGPTPSAVLALAGSQGRIVREIMAAGPDCFLTDGIERGALLNVEHIRSLVLSPYDAPSLRFAGLLLQHYGRHATDVELNVRQSAWHRNVLPPAPAFLEACSMASCERIQRLRLFWMVASGRPGYSEEDLLVRLSDAYGAVLSSTPTTTLRELEFTFWEGAIGPLKDFAKVATHVAHRIVQAVGRFPDLKRVVLVIEEPLTVDRCTTIINDLLPGEIVERRLVIFELEDRDRW